MDVVKAEYLMCAGMALLAGIYALAVGRGHWLPPVKDFSRADAWMAEHGKKMRVIGSILIVCAIGQLGLMWFF